MAELAFSLGRAAWTLPPGLEVVAGSGTLIYAITLRVPHACLGVRDKLRACAAVTSTENSVREKLTFSKKFVLFRRAGRAPRRAQLEALHRQSGRTTTPGTPVKPT